MEYVGSGKYFLKPQRKKAASEAITLSDYKVKSPKVQVMRISGKGNVASLVEAEILYRRKK
jgi:hypothetical protein